MMQRLTAAMLLRAFSLAVTSTQAIGADTPDRSWSEQSSASTRMLLDGHLAPAPEEGSQQGLAKSDSQISNPTLADQLAERRELESVLAKITAARTTESNKHVKENL